VRIVAADRWYNAALKWKQLADEGMGQIQQQVAQGQGPELKDIADLIPIYKRYWAQWKYLMVTDVMQSHWESANGGTKK
jgi:hypothetical protein